VTGGQDATVSAARRPDGSAEGAGGGTAGRPAAGTRAKRVVLLSGSLGMGHDALATTCVTSLRASGWSAETLDAMRLLGRGGGSAGEAVFRTMLALPGLYDAFHFAALRTGSRLALLADAGARRQIVPHLRDYLDRNPADLAISVFATGASAVSSLAERYPAMSHVVFCTDATPHRLWVHKNVDLYLVTSAVAEPAVLRFQPDAHVLVVPGAVRADFYRTVDQPAARARVGVPVQERCVLLMSGAWGLGPVAAAAGALGDAGVHVLAVAGRNARLERRLRAVARRQPRVRTFGFTDRIPDLMTAADLVITSSGDTCTEARTVGRPLLLLDVVQGHGRDNLQHELELGNAAVTSAGAADVVRSALAMLDRIKPPPAGPTRSLADWERAFSAALHTIGC
jgi:UDP-N-acetylglucosamine:LPS N-acetylglucosamine transferase